MTWALVVGISHMDIQTLLIQKAIINAINASAEAAIKIARKTTMIS
jgi:hypothetical protein